MLPFRSWRSLEPFQTWGTLGARKPWVTFDDVVRTWGARGPWKTFRAGDTLIALIAFQSLDTRKTFLTLESWNSWQPHITLGACDSRRATNTRQALESGVSLGPWNARRSWPAWIPLFPFPSVQPREPCRPHGSRKPWNAGLSLRSSVSLGTLYSTAGGTRNAGLPLRPRGTHKSLFAFGSRNSGTPSQSGETHFTL